MRVVPVCACRGAGRRCRSLRITIAAVGMLLHAGARGRALEELIDRTASAFGSTAPARRARSLRGRLAEYAAFTRDQAAEALQDPGRAAAVTASLYDAGLSLGAHYRNLWRVRTLAEAMAAASLVYRAIGIAFSGFTGGGAIMTRCFFSSYYSPATCALISGLDRGLLAGLSGGSQLRFCSRITEGAANCIARLEGVPA